MIYEFKVIMSELEQTLSQIDEAVVDHLTDSILNANRVVVVGVGRVMLSMKAWVKRLKHFDVDINYFGSETEGAVKSNDLVIVASSSGESLIPKMIGAKAKELNVDVYYIGCTKGSSVDKVAKHHLLLPGKTKYKHPEEFQSVQPMSTLFEQQLYLLGDCVALKIMKKKNLDEANVKRKHANLE